MLRDGTHISLSRLRYSGSAHSFGFSICSAADDRYQDAVRATGLPIAPQEPLDTARTVHLADLLQEPAPYPEELPGPAT